jgi:hypothetical protein
LASAAVSSMMDFFRSFFEDIFSGNRPAGTVAAILLFQHYQRPPKLDFGHLGGLDQALDQNMGSLAMWSRALSSGRVRPPKSPIVPHLPRRHQRIST